MLINICRRENLFLAGIGERQTLSIATSTPAPHPAVVKQVAHLNGPSSRHATSTEDISISHWLSSSVRVSVAAHNWIRPTMSLFPARESIPDYKFRERLGIRDV